MYKQYELPYSFDALEPYIDAETMETHSTKHHAAYTKKLNEAAEKAGVFDMEIDELLASLDSISDADLRKALRNNGGGFYNHNLYFSTMAPDGGKKPEGELAKAIDDAFGSFDSLKEKLTKLAADQFGSGWAWLSVTPQGKLVVSSSPNQDNPIIEGTGNVPILGIDVWEHAYYLKYKNLRPDYLDALYNVIDWKAVAKNFENVKSKSAQPVG